MLKKVTLLGLILGVAGVAIAETSTKTTATKPASGTKVVMVELPKVMGSEASKSSEAYVKKVQSEQETKIKKMDADLEKQRKALQDKAKVADLDALEKDQEKLNDAIAKRDLAAKSAGEKIRRAADSEMRKLSKVAQEAAEKLRKKLGVDMIITETGAVMACDNNSIVTDDLVKEMIKIQKPTSSSSAKKSTSTKSTKKSAKKK